MHPSKAKMTPYQLGMLLVTGVASTSILLLPANAVTFALRDGWLAPIAASPVAVVVIWIAASLAKRFPDETFVEYAPKALGKVPGKVAAALIVWYFFHLDALLIREFGDFVIATTMPETPISLVLFMTMVGAAWAVRNGPEVIGRLGELFTPLSIVLILAVLALVAQRMDPALLLPFVEFGVVPVLRAGAVTQGFLTELVVLVVLFPSVNSLDRGVKASFWALVTIVCLLVVTNVGTIALFGDLTARFTFPFFSVTRVASLGPVVARIDPLIIGFWIGGVALKVTLFLYATTVSFSQLFNVSDYRPLVLPMAGLVATFGLAQTPNIVEFGNLIPFVWPIYSLIFTIALPGLVLLVASIRRAGGQAP